MDKQNWKQENHKTVSNNCMRDEATTEQATHDFLEVAKTKTVDFSKSTVYNADQSSFERKKQAK
jgi:hypothetical protein